jgi:hypothetical protein
LAYADENIVGEKNTVQKNTKALLHASKDTDLEVNPEKTKYNVTLSEGRTKAQHKDSK